MRLWSYQLVPYLPRQQLISQWCECCCIARIIKVNGTPNHILVNKILEYPDDEFNTYAVLVASEMKWRGYKCDLEKFFKYRDNCERTYILRIFEGWHNKSYMKQCMSNLMEKYECGGISGAEWNVLLDGYENYTGEAFEI